MLTVPFLNPIGILKADASSRCTCDSVVLAPIAPQLVNSAVNCGEIVSRLPAWFSIHKSDNASHERGKRTKEFTSSRQTHLGQIQQQLSSDPQPLVNLESPVHVGVVDESFPSDGRPRPGSNVRC